MALQYLILFLFNFVPHSNSYDGYYYRDAKGVNHFGLEGLSMDILEKIRRATAYPSNEGFYSNFLAAQSILALKKRPYKKGKKKTSKGSKYRFLGGEKLSHKGGKHHTERKKSGSSGKEKWMQTYDENLGSKNIFMDESEFTDDHYHQEEGGKDNDFKGGHKHEKAYLTKGFEDVYHKDETKISDLFWKNEEVEGKWVKFGTRARSKKKNAKKEKKESEEKEVKEAGQTRKEGKEEDKKESQEDVKKESKKSFEKNYEKKDTVKSKKGTKNKKSEKKKD